MPRICKEKCIWLPRSKYVLCNKPATGDYCSKHRWLAKRGSWTCPCTVCGKGIQNEFKLCVGCGYTNAWRRQKRSIMKQISKIQPDIIEEITEELEE